jgi:hypothetical protein
MREVNGTNIIHFDQFVSNRRFFIFDIIDAQAMFMRVEGEFDDLPVTYFVYIHVEKWGEDENQGETVQLATYTVTDFLDFIEDDVMDFMNGFVYGDKGK